MSARKAFFDLARKAGLLLGVILVMTMLLAAMPGHHAPVAQGPARQGAATPLS